MLSFTSCREVMPDPTLYADLLESSFDALQQRLTACPDTGDCLRAIAADSASNVRW